MNIKSLKTDVRDGSAAEALGGFGQSSYLFNSLKAHVAMVTPETTVLQPTKAWTAVVRGAVLCGLEGTELVPSRRARLNYDIRYSRPFNPLLDPESCKKWDKYDEEWKAINRMVWYIRKDQVCSTNDPVASNFA